MARGLQELIDFLLSEVALCGDQGATVPVILKKIELFYRSSQDETQHRQNVDHRFQAKVWSWLTRRSDVSVGKENEWKHLTFDQVLDLEHSIEKDRPEAQIPAEVAEKNAENEDSHDSSKTTQVRIFVSEERTWFAITGHEPDTIKVPASEFGLLSIIAARKSEGITQMDLVTLSGQDKRSVPKRTDALAAKGYIDKRKIQVAKHRTSLLTLSRFANMPATETNEDGEQKTEQTPMIDFDDLSNRLFQILETSENHIMGRNDLKEYLGYKEIWYSRILSRAIRKWEQIGVLRRVRAKSQYGKFHDCVERLRAPTKKDFERFHDFNKNEPNKPSRDGADPADLDEEMEAEADVAGETQADADEALTPAKTKDQSVPESEYIVANWTPDRNLANQIFDIINNAGTNGITNNLLSRYCFGLYFRRPAECLFHRLTDCWQYSQPPHLRHLAVVRDSDVHKTSIHYVQYSAIHFGKKVEQGTTFWEAVEFHPEKYRHSKVKVPPIHAPFEVDEHGLPTKTPPGLLKDGNISLYEGIWSCRPSDYSLTCRDPVGVYYKDGSYHVEPGTAKTKGKLTAPGGSATKKSHPRPDSAQTTPSRAPKRRKRELSVISEAGDHDEIIIEDVPIIPKRRPQHKKSQSKYKKYKHLGKRERFEALGWDESWTEYSALVMEKPTPGVYVTPVGKRRPAGKKQGRPKQSRIAVFKLPGLSSLPWFTKGESSDLDLSEADETLQLDELELEQSTPAPTTPNPEPESNQMADLTPTLSRKGKRDQSPAESSDVATPAGSGRPLKQRRVRGPENGIEQQTVQMETGTEQASDDLDAANDQKNAPLAVQTDSQGEESLTQKRPGSSQTARRDPKTPSTPSRPSGLRKLVTPIPQSSLSRATPMSESQDETRKHISTDRGGSIPFIRRRIIMDIIEKAGGAYPAGSELWYPFATAWMKLNYQEKPDSRTLNRTIGHLVDAGLIQKVTCSAKDSKGVMSTKTILRKPDMSPDDPLIQRMRSELSLVDRDMRVPFAPGIEINQSLSKHNNGGGKSSLRNQVAGKQGRAAPRPLITDSFHLRSKPPSLVRQEEANQRRVAREWQRQLYNAKYMVDDSSDDEDEDGVPFGLGYYDYDDDDDEEDDEQHESPAVHRLMRFFPHGGPDVRTHFIRPHTVKGNKKETPKITRPPRPPGRPRLLQNIFSTTGKMTFLLNPGQMFFSATGTFGTGSIHHKRRGGIPTDFADSRANINIPPPNHVRVLTKLASQHLQPSKLKAKRSTDSSRFSRTIDMILRWEVDHNDIFDQIYNDNPFIEHHTSLHFHSEPIQGLIRFDFEQPKPAPSKKLPRMKLRVMSDKKVGKRGAPRGQKDAGEKRTIYRRRANIKPLPEGVVRKYMVAIVAVRTLAGGNQGTNVDWELVPLAFPDTNPTRAIQIAKSILTKNRMEIHKMQHDFQERYILAYQRDKVPQINFDDLAGYNWKAVVEWASIELEFTTSEKVPTLPATRDQFDSMFELREEPAHIAEELHTTTSGLTVVNKRRLMARIPFAVDQPRSAPPPRKEYLKQIEIAKTWVRANVTTAQDEYDPVAARAKLEEFSGILPAATQSLIADRVICSANRGRAMPGRNFMMHDFFVQAMERRRGLDSIQLARAESFKTSVLDVAFQQEGAFKIDYHAPDGDSVALGELAAKGYIELVPINPPRVAYGLMDGGYLTRQMDKDVVRFEMEARPLPSYVYGNPIQSLVDDTPIPGVTPAGHCPLWIDINGHFIQDLWGKSVASVLGCLLLRSGVSADAITFMSKPGLMKWEVEVILEEWLLKIGVVDKFEGQRNSLWSLKEWWWLVVRKPESETSSSSDAQAPLPIDPMLTAA